MVVLRRIKHYLIHNMLLSMIYMVIFVALFITFTFAMASSKQLGKLQSSLGNSVLVSRPGEYFINQEEVDLYIDFEGIRDYNLLSYGRKLLEDCEPYVYDEEKYQLRLQAIRAVVGDDYTIPEEYEVLGVTDSESSPYFTKSGLSLEEGRHITRKDRQNKVVLVSENFAKANGLKIGNKIRMYQDNSQMAYELLETDAVLELTVVGLFSTSTNNSILPKENYDNAIMIPENVAWSTFPDFPPTQLMVYLKNASDIQEYVEKLQAMDAKDAESDYEIIWNKEVYETISKPMQELNQLGGILLTVVITGCIIIMLILGYLNITGHRREWGILLTLGRDKWKIALEGALEALVPVVAGAALAVVLGAGASEAVSEQIGTQYAARISEENEMLQLEQERADNASQSVQEQFYNMGNAYVTAAEKVDFSVDAVIIVRFIVIIFAVSVILFFLQIYIVMHCRSIKKLLE